jgi:restriction endonuclease S subunit
MTITGRVGTTALIPDRFEGNINQHSVKMVINENKINKSYFVAFLNSKLGKKISNRGVTGGTRIALDYEAIREIEIPLPSLAIQQKIASEISSRQEKAKQSRKEAVEILEEAKKEVESVILGK